MKRHQQLLGNNCHLLDKRNQCVFFAMVPLRIMEHLRISCINIYQPLEHFLIMRNNAHNNAFIVYMKLSQISFRNVHSSHLKPALYERFLILVNTTVVGVRENNGGGLDEGCGVPSG